MPKRNKANAPSEIQQLTFFTVEEESGASENVLNTEPDPKALITSGEGDASAENEINHVSLSGEELSDTEIIESEILPEQAVEPTTLSGDEITETTEITDTAEITETENEVGGDTGRRRRTPRTKGSLRRESILVYFLILLVDTVSRKLRNSLLASVLTAYDKTAELFKASFLYSFFASKPASLFKSFKKHVRRTFTDSRIPKMLGTVTSALMLIKVRIYGLMLLSFGISALFVHFFINLYFAVPVFSIYTPFIASGIMIASLFLIFSGKTLSQALVGSRIFSAFSTGLLGFTPKSFNDRDCIELSGSGSVVLGLLLGLLTVAFPIQSILFSALSVIYVIIVIKSPEAGLISLFLLAPFASIKVLTYAIILLSVSYILKVLCGKRTLMLEFPDLFVGIFIFMLFFGGIITFGEKGNVLTDVLFTGVYFIAASILRSEIWFKRSINSILLVGGIISVYAVIARFLGEMLGFNLDSTLETDVGDATANILSSFSVLSYFVLMLGIFLLAYLLICRHRGQRFGLIIANISAVIFLFSTLPNGAWLAAVSAYVIILVLWKSRSALYMLLISLFLPFLPALKIHSVENFFHSIISVTERYDLWNAVIRMFSDFGIFGIGLGENAFSSLYPAYFIGNTENATHSGSLLLQILISLGIFGLLIFAVIIFFTLQSSLSYGRSCSDKSGFNRLTCYAGMCGIIASFLWGINEFIWYNPRTMLLFWLIMGVTVAARRSALSLESDDKQTNLYGDTYLE